jgi:hypothetical protein
MMKVMSIERVITQITVELKEGEDITALHDFLMEEFDEVTSSSKLLISSMSVVGYDTLMLTLEVHE